MLGKVLNYDTFVVCNIILKLITFSYLERLNLNLDTYVIALSKEIQCKSVSFCGCQSNRKGRN